MPRLRALVLFATVLAGGALAFFAGNAGATSGCTITWSAPGDAAWSNPGSWAEERVPNATDVVCLPAAGHVYTVTITGSQSVASLVVDPGITLDVRPGYATATTLTLGGDSVNNGTIVLDESDRYATAGLTVSSGTLTNTGILRTALGSADCCPNARTLTGAFANSGTLAIDLTTTVNGSLGNTGAVTVADGQTLTFTGTTSSLSQNGGTVTSTGALTVDTGTLTFAGGSFEGSPPVVNAGHIVMSGVAPRAGEVRAHGATDLTGSVPNGVTVRLRTGYGEPSVLSVPASLVNAGTIVLDHGDRYGTDKLAIASGQTLTNTGTIRSWTGTADCCTGERRISGTLVNQGGVLVDADTVFDGATTNQGTVTVAPNATATLSGDGVSFTQQSGTLDVQGHVAMNAGTFTHSGGDITGNAVSLGGNRLVFGPGPAARSGTYLVHGTAPTIGGNIPPGVTVDIRPGYGETTTLTSDGSFANDGTIVLDHADRYGTAKLVVPGTLTNNGMLRSALGTADCCVGDRTFTGNLVNAGTLDVAYPLTLDTTDGSYVSTGTVTIETGRALTVTGKSQTFEIGGGTLDVQGTLALSNMTFRYTGGAITGSQLSLADVHITFGSTAAAVPFVLRGTVDLVGDVPEGQTLAVRPGYGESATLAAIGDAVTNHGTIALEASDRYATATLDVTGTTFHNAGTIVSRLGLADCCQNGRVVKGAIDNTGTISAEIPTTYTGALHNAGTVTTPAGGSLSLDSVSSLTQTDGSFGGAGTTTVTGGTLSFAGGAIDGIVGLDGGSLTFPPGSTATGGEVRTRHATALTGDVPSGMTVRVRAPFADTATLTPAGSFTNHGTIVLDHADRYGTPTLALNGATLTNEGTLAAGRGATDCCATESVTGGTVINNGTVASGNTLAMDGLDNHGTVQVTGGTLRVTTLANYAANTLTGGIVEVGNGSTFLFGGGSILHNASSLRLSGNAAVTDLNGTRLTDGMLNNSGTLTLLDGQTFAVSGAFANTGTVDVEEGGTFTAAGAYTQSGADAASVVLDESPGSGQGQTTSRIGAPSITLDDGVLLGNGVVEGPVVNTGGTVSPQPLLHLAGAYTQQSDGTTDLDVSSLVAGGHDVLDVAGTATLDGTLALHTGTYGAIDGLAHDDVLTATAVTGQYATTTGNGLSSGWLLEPSYGPAAVRLDVTEHVLPGNPVLGSTSHTVNTWSTDPTVDVTFTGATDTPSGVAGFSYAWSTSATTVPDAVADAAASATGATSPALASGDQWFHLRTVDAEGNWSAAAHLGPFRIDVTKPAGASLATMAPYTTLYSATKKAPVLKPAWSGAHDANSGIAGYRVAYRSAPLSTGVYTATAYSGLTTATSWTLYGGPGRTYCFRVETRDKAGNVAALSAERCQATPLDNTALTGSKTATHVAQWSTTASGTAYYGSLAKTATLGASLKSGTVKTRKLALVVSKCATCGSVAVYWNGVQLGTYSLAGSGHVVVPVKSWATTQTGVVTIKTTAAKTVYIDALAAGLV